ncbi:50S ribosomal protein L25/general stress protein Ctc [Kerstersia similis]|uniref:50S ribosomal protein L25/general stress protein Ctc n=1 Tax=Kerstersia similis TaxID=206505 RepID=UPI0039F0F8C2
MQFNATTRSVQGSSASRRLRRAGRVPAIVYGGTEQPLNIELDHNEIYHALRKEAFHASILSMQLEGKTHSVLLRSVQWHAYKPQVLHVDFQRVLANEAITTKVPLNFINGEQSPAVKLGGAMISHVVTEVEVKSLPADLPASIDVDLANLQGGESVHLSSLVLPKGVTALGDATQVLATAIVPAGGAAESEAEA